MRTTILMGLLLVALGALALFQVRNGYFLSMVGRATYSPPSDPAEMQAAFDRLAALESKTPGVTLGDIAAARVTCARIFSGKQFDPNAVRAFTRLNLMMLGAGVDAFTPVVAPQAFRITEIRPDFTQDATDWKDKVLTVAERRRLDDILSQLVRPDHPAYGGIDFSSGFTQFDFSAMVEVMMRGGRAFHECVAERRGG